jgi:hypothetical protein
MTLLKALKYASSNNQYSTLSIQTNFIKDGVSIY